VVFDKHPGGRGRFQPPKLRLRAKAPATNLFDSATGVALSPPPKHANGFRSNAKVVPSENRLSKQASQTITKQHLTAISPHISFSFSWSDVAETQRNRGQPTTHAAVVITGHPQLLAEIHLLIPPYDRELD
jgi:hypothetical protein